MTIVSLNKLTLLDYPNKMAVAVFFSGCNFDCAYCHNAGIIDTKQEHKIDEQEVLDFLHKRKNILEGVCLTGAECLMSGGLEQFILKIKAIKDYKIKLDTNGAYPDALKQLLDKGLVDYVAMDIKGSLENYLKIARVNINIDAIKKSIDIIKTHAPDYEFRTTLIKEYHSKAEFFSMLDLIKGAKRYALQEYIKSENVRAKDLTAFSKEETDEYAGLAKEYIKEVLIRN